MRPICSYRRASVCCAPIVGAICFVAGAVGAVSAAAEESGGFRYVVPSDPPAGFAPKVNWLPLATSPPAILLASPPQTSETRRYALLRYGAPDSTQIVLILDETADGSSRLFVERQRTGRARADDLIHQDARAWRTRIESQIPRQDEPPEAFSREIEIRSSASGAALGVATAGFMEGTITLGGTSIGARRVDGNANGLFADPQDRLWLDLDADGRWDPFTEQFPFAPIVKIGGTRFAVRSDLAGERLALEEITGSGTLRLELRTVRGGYRVRELDVALMGDDGTAYAARADGASTEVPPGRFAVRSLGVVLVDEVWGREWRFVFMRAGDPQSEHWHQVDAGQTVTIDPVGQLALSIGGDDLNEPITAGRQITVEPQLHTHEGLFINACEVSGADPLKPLLESGKPGAEVELCLADGTIASSYRSGFS